MTTSSAAGTAQADRGPLALFISDLHLQASHPKTAQAFLTFLRTQAVRAKALYLLGDLFEAWAGDDDLDEPFNRQIIDALRAVSDAGTALFWIAGNRDFLVGDGFAGATGATLLPDPYVIDLAGRRIALAHGDAQCTDDVNYMKFRAMVRAPEWQRQFLAQPLEQRKAIIAGLRDGSRADQANKSMAIMDVNADAVERLYAATGTEALIHGHTHRPARHVHGTHVRYVLPDWELDGGAPRGGWLAVGVDGAIARHGVDGALL